MRLGHRMYFKYFGKWCNIVMIIHILNLAMTSVAAAAGADRVLRNKNIVKMPR